MENKVVSFILLAFASSCFIYLLINMFLQVRAKNRLEKQLLLDSKLIEELFKKYDIGDNEAEMDAKYEFLISQLRKEIGTLENETDKSVMKKTLDRKNYHNQKQYAFKIFSEVGLTKSLGLK